MNKQAFLRKLRRGLSNLPSEDVKERLSFYSEMIDDRMEEGLSEEAAIREIGAVDEITAKIMAENPKTGSSHWLWLFASPILIALAAAGLALYAALWAVILSLWAVTAAMALSGPVCAVAGIRYALGGAALTGIAVLGAGLVCAGLSVFLFYGSRQATKWMLLLTKKLGRKG